MTQRRRDGGTARPPAVPERDGTAARPDPAEVLAAVLSREATPADRLRAFRELGITVWSRVRDASGLVGYGADLLAVAAARLRIRDADALRGQYGPDGEAIAARVIDEAATLAGWLWTAAAVLPAPPRVTQVIKVIVHSAIEIRMIAELRAIDGDPDPAQGSARLGAILQAWASGVPVPTGAVPVSARPIVARLRESYEELTGDGGGPTGWLGGGRAQSVRRYGWRLHRRMRTHPVMWGVPHGPAAGAGTPPGLLDAAWAEHVTARGAAAAVPAGDQPPVTERLARALALQHRQLCLLAGALDRPPPEPPATLDRLLPEPPATLDRGLPEPPATPPPADRSRALTLAHIHINRGDDLIDQIEVAGARPRRLAGWPAGLRNGLVYLVISVVLSIPMVCLAAVAGTDSFAATAMMLAWSLTVVPGPAYALSMWTIGRLYRPWIGRRTPRSPLAGLAICAAVAVVTTVVIIAVG